MKTRIIAYICFFLQLHRVSYFLNRNRKRIITFHNVLSDECHENNVANGVSMSLSSFSAVINEIEKRFRFSNNLEDSKSVTLTFDDGYRNQAEVAGAFLMSRGIPAYLFVSGQLIETDETPSSPLIIDKLLHWVSKAPVGKYQLEISGKEYEFEIVDSNRDVVWSTVIWPLFNSNCDSKGENLFEKLNELYPYSEIEAKLGTRYIHERLNGISINHLQKLKDNGWKIGWHTHSHYPVARLSSEEKIKELTPFPVCNTEVFSFPYGGMTDADSESFDILRSLGYKTAVSNVNKGNEIWGTWYRSRMSLSPEPALLHFELSGLRYLLKYRSLLPKY